MVAIVYTFREAFFLPPPFDHFNNFNWELYLSLDVKSKVHSFLIDSHPFFEIIPLPGHRRPSQSTMPFRVFLFRRTLPLLPRLGLPFALISLHLCLEMLFKWIQCLNWEFFMLHLFKNWHVSWSLRRSKVLLNNPLQIIVYICISADICMSKS